MKYRNYAADYQALRKLMDDHLSSGDEMSSHLLKAAELACNYYSHLVKEKDFFKWLAQPANRKNFDNRDIVEFRTVVIPHTVELLKKIGFEKPDEIEAITEDAYTIFEQRKASNTMDNSGIFEERIRKLQKEVCAQAGLATNEYADMLKEYEVLPAEKKKGFFKRISKPFWDVIDKASKVAGVLALMIQLHTEEPKRPDPPAPPTTEIQNDTSAKPIPPNTHDATKDFWKHDLNRRLTPPGGEDQPHQPD